MFGFVTGILGRPMGAQALASASVAALIASASPALAQEQERSFNIPAQPLSSALIEFSRQSDVRVLADPQIVNGRQAPAVIGSLTPTEALNRLLAGSGLQASQRGDGGFVLAADSSSPTQLGAADSGAEEEIIVTGTRIRGNSIAPVLEFTREDMERSTATNVADFMREVPQTFSGSVGETVSVTLVARAGDGSDNRTRSTANDIRGLGSGATLTLLDGRRIAPSGNGDFVDISAIPLGAIERIEILPDGASSIYGSDAIAGVVNVVLRDRYDGAETTVGYGGATDGDYDETRASQTFGFSWNTGGVLAAYDFRETGALRSGERAVASNDRPDVTLLAPTRRQSLLIRADQQFGVVDIFGSALTSAREADALDYSSNDTVQDRITIDADSTALSIGAGADLPGAWRLELSGSYSEALSRYEVFSVQTNRNLVFRGESAISGVDVTFDGPVLTLPAGDMRAAIGSSYYDTETITSNTLTTAAGVTFRPAINANRHVTSIFAETLVPIIGESSGIPLVHRLDLDVSARWDRYSDFGETTNPKVSLRWDPASDFRITASWGTSFRAPDFFDMSIAPSYLLDTVPDPLSPTGFTTALVIGGVSDLEPETSESTTLTLQYEPAALDGLNLSVGLYRIEFEDRIAVPAVSWIDMFANPAAFAGLINRNPTAAEINAIVARGGTFSNFTASRPGGLRSISDATAIADFSRQNVSQTFIEGVDFSGRYAWEFDAGTLLASLSGTLILDKFDRATPSAPPVDTYDRSYLTPRLSLRAMANWSTDVGSVAVSANFREGYPDTYAQVRGFPPRDVADITTYDLVLSANSRFFGWREDPRTLTARLLVRDMFDEGAPFVYGALAHQPNFDPANSDIRGRLVAIELRKVW